MKSLFSFLTFLIVFGYINTTSFAGDIPENFKKENLIAWCIVPFDSLKRNPAERASMLVDLGLQRVAYDWRKEHIPEFEEEILQYKKHGLEYFAFWNEHDEAFKLFKKHGIRPQIWKTNPSPKEGTQKEKVMKAADILTPLAEKSAKLGSKFGLYNHGGWGGEPGNMVAVCKELHRRGFKHVGIVYNFHHAHDSMDQFSKVLHKVKPYLLCLNLNGMIELTGTEQQKRLQKIMPIGAGKYEAAMIQAVVDSGYKGPVGILGHITTQDVAKSLQNNLDGLDAVMAEIKH
ncbi:MAG: hypothetical protein AB3N63_06490 [Puniceicoccaceae bacterium]